MNELQKIADIFKVETAREFSKMPFEKLTEDFKISYAEGYIAGRSAGWRESTENESKLENLQELHDTEMKRAAETILMIRDALTSPQERNDTFRNDEVYHYAYTYADPGCKTLVNPWAKIEELAEWRGKEGIKLTAGGPIMDAEHRQATLPTIAQIALVAVNALNKIHKQLESMGDGLRSTVGVSDIERIVDNAKEIINKLKQPNHGQDNE